MWPKWRNGRRAGLKIRFSQESVGSSPTFGNPARVQKCICSILDTACPENSGGRCTAEVALLARRANALLHVQGTRHSRPVNQGPVMIKFQCSCCGQWLQLGDEWAGKWAKCPHSGKTIQVPLGAQAPTAAAITPQPVSAFNQFGNVVLGRTQADSPKSAEQRKLGTRGMGIGAGAGALLGLLFGLIFGVALGSTGLLVLMGLFAGASFGAGLGGIVGRIYCIVSMAEPQMNTGQPAIKGAIQGTLRLLLFTFVGGIAQFLLVVVWWLALDEAVSLGRGVVVVIVWCVIAAIVGAIAGGVLGALGGNEE